MARIKKAQKGTTLGFEERMNQNIDKNINDQMNKLDQGLQTIEPKSTKKFKIGQREFDMDDNFLQNLSDDLYKNNIQGQSVTKIMDLIRSGGIEGIDDGGNFYGTDLGGAEKNTRANRAWNIGRGEIRDLQDTGAKMTGIIRGTYDRLNKPVAPEAPKTYNLSNRSDDLLSTYAYHGNAIPEGWNNMSIEERVKTFGNALIGYQSKLGEFEGQAYDPTKHIGITEGSYNLLGSKRGSMVDDFNKMSAKWLADGVIDENELNEYRTKYSIDLSGKFGARQLNPEEIKKAEENKKLEDERLAKEKLDEENKKAKSIAFDPETGQYTLGGNPYSGDWNEQDGSKLLIEAGTPYSGLKETEDEYIPYYKGKAVSYDAIKKMYNDPNLSQTEKDKLGTIYASIGDIRRGFINQDPNNDLGKRSQTGRAGVQGFNQYRFIDQDTALGNEYNTPNEYRIYEGISNIPSKYGVTSGKRVTVLETPQGKKQGVIRNVNDTKYFYPSDGSEPIRLGGDPSKQNKDWYYQEGKQQSSTQDGSSNRNVITAEVYKNLSQEEKRKYSSSPRTTDGKYVRISKEGGKILHAQQGTKLVYQEAPKESTYRGSNVDFDKINAYKKASLDRDNLRSQSATGREVFDKNVELSVADKADLTALGLDVAGLVAGFTGIGSVGAGILGGASTAAQLGADISRDGLDWGDVGNAAMGFGLDVTSALPGLGQFSKGAKTLKALKKSSKVLGGLFATYGLVNGTQGLKNVLEKGQDATIDDWKMLAQGLQSVAMGTKQGMKYLGTKKTNPKFGLKVGDQDVQFDTEDAAKSFAQKHKDFKTKSAELQKLTAENADQKLINQKAQETQNLVNELKTISGNKDFDGLADVKTKTSLNPFTFKGFGKKGDRNINPFGLKEGEAKVYQTSDREIRAVGDGNWAERLSASWLRKQNNLDGNLKDRNNKSDNDKPNNDKPNQNKPDQKNKKLTPKDIERLKKEGEGKRNERAKNKKEYESYLNDQKRDRDLKLTSMKAKKEHSKLMEDHNDKLANEIADGREKASKERKYLDGEYQRNKNKEAKKADDEKLGNEMAEGREKAKSERESKQTKYLISESDAKEKERKRAATWEVNRAKQEASTDKRREAGRKSQKAQKEKKELEEKNRQERLKKYKEEPKGSGDTLEDLAKKLNEDNNSSGKNSKEKTLKNYKEVEKEIQSRIDKLEGKKSPNKTPNKKYLKESDQDGNSKRSKNSKNKSKERKQLNKGRVEGDKKGYYLKKDGGILRFQKGSRLTWGGGDDIETGSNWKKLDNTLSSIATPANARFAATLVGNKKMMSELEKAKRPTNASPVYLDRIKNVGVSQVQPQLSEINSSVNSALPVYSDAKLNAAAKLSQLSAANKMKSDILGQLGLQNRQIDAQNQQIGQQETLQNAQITQQNAAKQDAFNQGLLTNKLGLIGSNVDAFSNKMLELERAKKLKQSRLDQINDQEFLLRQQANQKEAMDTFQKPWLEKAKLAGKDWSTYYSGLSKEESDDYLSEKAKAENQYLLNRTQAQKKYIQGSYFSKGGKMTIAEKKELEELKASKKRQLESDKAFNKLVLEKGKSHDKMLSLLSKDLKTSVKNILK